MDKNLHRKGFLKDVEDLHFDEIADHQHDTFTRINSNTDVFKQYDDICYGKRRKLKNCHWLCSKPGSQTILILRQQVNTQLQFKPYVAGQTLLSKLSPNGE